MIPKKLQIDKYLFLEQYEQNLQEKVLQVFLEA